MTMCRSHVIRRIRCGSLEFLLQTENIFATPVIRRSYHVFTRTNCRQRLNNFLSCEGGLPGNYAFLKNLHILGSNRACSAARGSVADRTNQDDELEDIYQRIFYTDDLTVAYNKPSGQSVHGSTNQIVSSHHPTLIKALPGLCCRLNCTDLTVGLSLKSFYSGIVLLCKSGDSKKHLNKILQSAISQQTQYISYLAITVGRPQCDNGSNLSAYISREFFHERELSVVKEKNNNKARKAGSMMMALYKVQTRAANEDLGVSLVEISINKDKWEAVESLLSYHLSPVLGDHIYSSRTQSVMGVPFRASAHSVLPTQQRLPLMLTEALGVYKPDWSKKPSLMPLFLHRHKVVLNKYTRGKDGGPLVLTAQPPEEFVSLLKHLGLHDECWS